MSWDAGTLSYLEGDKTDKIGKHAGELVFLRNQKLVKSLFPGFKIHRRLEV